MKHVLFCLIIGLTLFGAACEEIPPVVTPYEGPPDTIVNPDSQLRQVLIEEFTGVRCVQCPAGSADIEALLTIHGQQLIAVSIHAGDFSHPFPQNVYNFQTPEGDELNNFLGPPISYPSAVVNRKLFDGESDLVLGRNDWAGYIGLEKALEPKVKIGLKADFNETNRKLDIEIKLFPQEDILDPDVRLSIMLTESNIVDYQDTPNGKVSDYVHKHALRDMVTSFLGDEIAETLVAGGVVTKNYSYTVPETWNPDEPEVVEEEVSVIVFVHLGSTSKEVLQAMEVHMIE